MQTAATQIRSHRLAAGLSQRALARRAGTSSATLCRYESGAIDPSVGTLNRLLRACQRQRLRWPSVADLAPALARTLNDADAATAWRLVGELLDDDAGATDLQTSLVVMAAPEATGDSRVDALVGAIAEHLCVRRSIVPPPWTQVFAEAVPWWFVAGPAFSAMALRESPASFARRGIFITAGALERV